MGFGDSLGDSDIRNLIQRQVENSVFSQSGPYGSTKVEPGRFGRPGRITTKLSPEQQRILEQQQAGQLLGGRTGMELLGAFPGNPMGRFVDPTLGMLNQFRPGDFEKSRSAVEQAQFQRGLNLLNPELQRQEQSMQARLANQGLPQASRAYGAETGRFAEGRANQLENLALSSVLAGGQEQSRLFGQQLATTQEERARLGQRFGQNLQTQQQNQGQRAQSLQEALGLLGLQQPQGPPQAVIGGVQVPQPQGQVPPWMQVASLLGPALGAAGQAGGAYAAKR